MQQECEWPQGEQQVHMFHQNQYLQPKYSLEPKFGFISYNNPFSYCLLWKIHFVSIILCFLRFGRSTNSQISFISNCTNPSCIEFIQPRSCIASSYFMVLKYKQRRNSPQKCVNQLREQVVGPGPGLFISLRIKSVFGRFATHHMGGFAYG